MKVLEQTQSKLVVEIRPVGLMILCFGLFLLFFILGFGMNLFLPSLAKMLGFPASMVPTNFDGGIGMHILGYASVIPLAIGVLMIKTRRVTLDRSAGRVTLASRGVLGASSKDYALSAFQGAMLGSSHGSDSGTTYRTILMFSDDNGNVPVTPYSTSGNGPARMVNAINTWFGANSGSGGPSVTLSGAQAQQVLAALAQAGIKIQR
jgi:hypothetical protein